MGTTVILRTVRDNLMRSEVVIEELLDHNCWNRALNMGGQGGMDSTCGQSLCNGNNLLGVTELLWTLPQML